MFPVHFGVAICEVCVCMVGLLVPLKREAFGIKNIRLNLCHVL